MKFFLYIFILTTLFSCTEKYSYDLNLTKNKTYRQRTISDSRIEQEVDGKEQITETRNSFEVLYKVVAKTDSSVTLNTRFTSIYLKLKRGNEEILLSSKSKDSSKFFNTFFKNMINREFKIIVSNKGKILKVENIENIFSKIFDGVSSIHPEHKELFLNDLKQYYNENMFQNLQLFGNNIYPNEKVAVDEKWKSENVFSNQTVKYKTNCELYLKKQKPKYAIINFNGKINTIENTESDINPISLKGTTEGAYKISPITGWIKEATIYQNINGFTEIPFDHNSRSVIKSPIKIDTKITIIGY